METERGVGGTPSLTQERLLNILRLFGEQVYAEDVRHVVRHAQDEGSHRFAVEALAHLVNQPEQADGLERLEWRGRPGRRGGGGGGELILPPRGPPRGRPPGGGGPRPGPPP